MGLGSSHRLGAGALDSGKVWPGLVPEGPKHARQVVAPGPWIQISRLPLGPHLEDVGRLEALTQRGHGQGGGPRSVPKVVGQALPLDPGVFLCIFLWDYTGIFLCSPLAMTHRPRESAHPTCVWAHRGVLGR